MSDGYRERRHRQPLDRPHESRSRHADQDSTTRPAKRVRGRRDTSSEDGLDLRKLGVERIPLDDPRIQAGPFRKWLKKERDLYIDELSRDEEAKYYRRFARRWNDGALPERYYRPARRRSRSASPTQPSSARRSASPAPHHLPGSRSPVEVGPSLPSQHPSHTSPRPSGSIGPSAPSYADIQLARDDANQASRAAYKSSLKSSYAHANDLVPKSIGKEGKMEEKRATAAANKAFADKEADREAVVDESTLMGAEGGFADAIRKRDAARVRREQEREMQMREKREEGRERLEERKRKEEDTMAMEMAKSRFG